MPTIAPNFARRARTIEPMPAHLAPMLAVLSEIPPDPRPWAFEFKWDGVRALCFYDGKQMRLESRNQLDITPRYPELHALASALGRRRVILDGEIVAMDDRGHPSFARLQRRMHVNDPRAIQRLRKEVPAFYILFDVLYLDRRWIGNESYQQRRHQLEILALKGPAWQLTPAREGDPKPMLDAAEKNQLEGLIAKRLDSIYEPGRRSPAWRKTKLIQSQELVIGGWIPEKGNNAQRVGSLQVGYYDRDGNLCYAGGVGTGFTAAEHATLTRLLVRHASDVNPFAQRVPKSDIRFVKPQLVAEFEYRRWPKGGMIQQAAYKGLRSDKPARDVVRERL